VAPDPTSPPLFVHPGEVPMTAIDLRNLPDEIPATAPKFRAAPFDGAGSFFDAYFVETARAAGTMDWAASADVHGPRGNRSRDPRRLHELRDRRGPAPGGHACHGAVHQPLPDAGRAIAGTTFRCENDAAKTWSSKHQPGAPGSAVREARGSETCE
jgi:hypothetical protein